MTVFDTSVWSLALRRPKGRHPTPRAARLLRHLVLSAALALGACGELDLAGEGVDDDGWSDCSLRTEEWFDEPVTEGTIDDIMASHDLSHRSEVTCEQVCYRVEDRWLYDQVDSILACSLDLEETPGKSSDFVVGTVDCRSTVQNCHGD